MREADAVFFATPEYNSSVPGALKNALDWGSRPIATNAFRNKPVAVISSSAGAFGGVWAAAELRKVLGAMGARVAEAELSVGHAHEKLDDQGRLADDDVRGGLGEALQTLLAEVSPRQRRGLSASDRVGVRHLFVLREPPLHDRTRQDSDELAAVDDGHALVVVLLEIGERVGEHGRRVDRRVRRLGDLTERRRLRIAARTRRPLARASSA